jgi:hypothetical protein
MAAISSLHSMLQRKSGGALELGMIGGVKPATLSVVEQPSRIRIVRLAS